MICIFILVILLLTARGQHLLTSNCFNFPQLKLVQTVLENKSLLFFLKIYIWMATLVQSIVQNQAQNTKQHSTPKAILPTLKKKKAKQITRKIYKSF